jgi:hypothetical protein
VDEAKALAHPLPQRVLRLFGQQELTNDQRLDRPAHGGIVVVHRLAGGT